MVNIKEINNRITSINSIINITHAMKLVSFAQMKKYKLYIKNFNKYYDHINYLFNISYNNNIINTLNNENILFIIVTSNKGLCGSFNNLLLNKLHNVLIQKYVKKKLYLLTIGHKGYYYLLSKNYTIYQNLSILFNEINFNFFSTHINHVISDYIIGKFDSIRIIYTKFISLSNQVVKVKNIIPIKLINNKHSNNKIILNSYFLDQKLIQLYNCILPTFLKCRIFLCILHSLLSENAFRMLNMYKAYDNSLNIKNSLKNSYNKLRQNLITQELCEVVNGFIYKKQ
jgi:F-type H+-transporting ATPase subunit gamma